MAPLQEHLQTVLRGARRLRGVLTNDRALFRESNTTSGELSGLMRRNAIPTSSFFLMLSLSGMIATFGLVADSAPAIIGAMIIAPLMAPIISLAFAIACVDRRLALLSISTIVAGVAATIAIAYAGVEIIGLQIAGSEILARASPSLLDLGVALAAGCAGAFAQVRPSIGNSVAGVAIAVALVPPLAVTGIGLSLGENAISETGRSLDALGYSSGGIAIAAGAFLLFLTNLIGIVAVAAFVFVIQRYGQWRKALPLIAIIVAGSFGMIPSLNQTLHTIYVKNRAVSLYVKYAFQPSEGHSQTSTQMLQRIQVGYRNGLLHVNADLLATRDLVGAVQEKLDTFRRRLSDDIGEPVVLEVEIIPIEILKAKSGPLAAKQ